jgi:hypothetical protein
MVGMGSQSQLANIGFYERKLAIGMAQRLHLLWVQVVISGFYDCKWFGI